MSVNLWHDFWPELQKNNSKLSCIKPITFNAVQPAQKTIQMSISKITKGTLVALFIMGAACTGMAQQQMQQRTPEERARRQTQMMQKKLGLTADQTQKVHDILLYYAGQADNVKADAAQGNNVRGERKDMKRNKDADLQAVLTGAQYQQYQQLMQQRKEQMQQRRNGGMQDGGN